MLKFALSTEKKPEGTSTHCNAELQPAINDHNQILLQLDSIIDVSQVIRKVSYIP